MRKIPDDHALGRSVAGNAGVDAAQTAGIALKINMVVLKASMTPDSAMLEWAAHGRGWI